MNENQQDVVASPNAAPQPPESAEAAASAPPSSSAPAPFALHLENERLKATIVRSSRSAEHQTYEIYRALNLLAESQSGLTVAEAEAEPEPPALPPSYSTVIKQGPLPACLRRDVRSMEAQHISPFRRLPPPSYSEVQTNVSHSSREVVSTTSSEQILFGPEPIFIWCQRCTTVVLTTTHAERSKFTHVAALALCLFGCWPCAVLPYCMNACKNTYHYCPECNHMFGMYRPW